VLVEGELRGGASNGSQIPRIWQGSDAPAGRRQRWTSIVQAAMKNQELKRPRSLAQSGLGNGRWAPTPLGHLVPEH
jgi:hypothetical protein